MEVLKFNLGGRTAFFKKPDVNQYLYFSYGNIHKIALLGILGAVLGYQGYNQQKRNEGAIYPEFYEKLYNIKIGISPKNDKGYIPKKVQTFNNSVGYANKHKGGNLVVKEQWLENPNWDIYVLINGELEDKLAKRIINSEFCYIPYLGKNDHLANISDSKIIKEANLLSDVSSINSLFIRDYFDLQIVEDDIEDDYVPIYKYQEMLPTELDGTTNQYILKPFIYTNSSLIKQGEPLVYRCKEENIFFF
ncbi:MAG: type I-B CRISPR-associated protein Cas5 [Syntrophomonadaceae bacterium]|nr:type I-B CRISPR-associated protein Cas5 [Syntrophomonadaceae bacterium]